ncbi:MAG: fibronectin type III domain-containing protein [Muribaculaceae bacterium]|nr:fibronectin type III domain-containing protein [Muribaculaceae bacterium]
MTSYKSLLTVALTTIGLAASADTLPGKYIPLEKSFRNAIATAETPSTSIKAVPDDGRTYTVVLEEDFSLVTGGAEEDPANEYINDSNNQIPSSYTHTPGWGGRAVMPAAGAVCLGYYTDPVTGTKMTGQLETPELDLHRDQGTAYLSFRARLLPGQEYDEITVRWVAETDFLPATGTEQTFYVNGFQWTNVDVTLTECPENAVIQIYAESLPLLIDDIKIEQYKADIEAPKALKWTEFTGDSFTANWTEVEGADHYIFNCFYIRREGTDDQLPDYKYVARDKVVKETSYHLSGLNRDKVYYYYIRAVAPSGAKSEESQLVEVLDLTVPDGIKVSDVTADGFRVSWDPVYNAEGYGFQAILDHTALKDETYDLLDESFDNIDSEGSIGNPYVNAIGMYDMDEYGMSRANWVMYEGGVIDGGIALHNYVSSYGTEYYGELLSPVMTIGQSTGEITIEADFATLDAGVRPYIQIAVPGVVDGQSQWTLGAGGEVKQNIGKDWTHVKVQYKIKPGLVRFSIGTTDGGWLFMDNLKISVNLPKDAVQRSLYHYNEIKDGLDAPTYYCPTIDRKRGDSYSFALMAARLRPGASMIPVYVLSEWSDTQSVPDVEMSGVDTVATDAAPFTVTTSAGAITIDNPAGREIVVTDITGRTVGRTAAMQATVNVVPGLYIVASTDGAAHKVLVK